MFEALKLNKLQFLMFSINRPSGALRKSFNSETVKRMEYKLQQFDLLKTVGKGKETLE